MPGIRTNRAVEKFAAFVQRLDADLFVRAVSV